MRAEDRYREKIFEREIAIAYGIETIGSCRQKPRSRASAERSILNAQPASAPEPIGQASAASAAAMMRSSIAIECREVRQ